MNTPNRAALIAKLQKVLKKHYKPVIPPERSLLEHWLYACCLENAPFDKADEAFAHLQENYFDWNGVRVTSANELAEVFSSLPQPVAAAHRVKKALQGVFDAIFTFDLEPLKKQNLGKSIKDIEKFGATPFSQSYVTQNALGGHAIAADEGTFDVLVVLGILSDNEAGKGLLPGIERAVPKTKGVEFFSELHQLAADFFINPNSTRLKGLLAEIIPDVKERVAARQAKRKEINVEVAKAVAEEKERERLAEEEMMNPTKPAVREIAKEKPTGKAEKPPKDGGDGKVEKPAKAKPAKGPEKSNKLATAGKAEKAKSPAKKGASPPPPKKKPAEPAKGEAKKKGVAASKPVSKGLSKKKPR